jgi:HSP20 family protein
MATTLRSRWSVPHSVQREMDQLFDHFFGVPNPGQANGNGTGASSSGIYAPASLWEEESQWVIEFDLPGVKQDDIDVTLEKNSLRLTAQRPAPQEDGKFYHQERTYGPIQRLISLPETVDPERIEAELKDGVLRLTLAKKPELQPKKIQVKAS